ncbi:MAG: DUF87 domain-containing protein [Sulfurovaceae bacterium]
MQEIYEKLGLFYAGKDVDKETLQTQEMLTLIKDKNFTTHATIIGMTGSGKTGLGVGLIEEAAIDNIPSIIIDPKGDMGNLCLTDPAFSPQNFLPWVKDEARLKGIDADTYAKDVATMWKEGIESWHQDAARVQKLHDVEKIICTPGSLSGIPVNIMSSLEVPPSEVMEEADIYASFFDKKSRFALATKFNSLLASSHFKVWLQGINLDIQKLLYDEQGKAKITIFSIAHLSDEDRMFFVSLLLNRYVGWMRRQSGTSALKTILYMDEIFGFFPPTKNPPSKEPMLTLLKQARAYGIGVVLSTQNPVDLDYKGLANIGTWFIGRLQTTQDIDRVIEGLGGKIGSSFERDEIRSLLSNLPKRTFFYKSIYKDDLSLFSTRWVLSYLKGPLNRDDIKELMKDKRDLYENTQSEMKMQQDYEIFERIDASISQFFEPLYTDTNHFDATLGAKVGIYFLDRSKGMEHKKELIFSLPINGDETYIDWSQAQEDNRDFSNFGADAPKDAQFSKLPECIKEDKSLKEVCDRLQDWLYETQNMELYTCDKLKLRSDFNEDQRDFTVRVQDVLKEKREETVEKLKERFEKDEKKLLDRLERAKDKLAKEEADTTSSFLSAGIAIVSAILGGTSSTKLSKVATAGKRAYKERNDVNRAKENVEEFEEDIQELSNTLQKELDSLEDSFTVENYPINTMNIKPNKRDISVDLCALVWRAGR